MLWLWIRGTVLALRGLSLNAGLLLCFFPIVCPETTGPAGVAGG